MEWAPGEGSEENGGTEDVSETPPWVASDAIYLDKLMCFCIFAGSGGEGYSLFLSFLGFINF